MRFNSLRAFYIHYIFKAIPYHVSFGTQFFIIVSRVFHTRLYFFIQSNKYNCALYYISNDLLYFQNFSNVKITQFTNFIT